MDVNVTGLFQDWMKWHYLVKLDYTLTLKSLMMVYHMDVLDLKVSSLKSGIQVEILESFLPLDIHFFHRLCCYME